MKALFSQVLNMSMTGSIVILLVVLARLLLKRFPKIFSYALWSVVLFRLLCPVALTAPVSVLDAFQPEIREASPSTSTVSYLPARGNREQGNLNFVPPEGQPEREIRQTEPTMHSAPDAMTVAAWVWIAGAAAMLLISAGQYVHLKRRLIGAARYRGNVYLADYLDTAFVMGIFRPRIYLPSNIPAQEQTFIIAHERHHIRRCDHILKLLAYFALCVHWFNPLVWAAFCLAGKDMEMSCDEAVIKRLGTQIRADYSASLLRLATHKKIVAGMPLAFGEGDTKGRVRNMANWKKPKLWVSILCMLLCAAILVACAVNPEKVGKIGDPNSDGPTATFSILPNDSEDDFDLVGTPMDGPVSAGLEKFNFTLPEGMAMQTAEIPNTGNAWDYGEAFYVGDTYVGGLALRYQAQANDPDSFSRAWQESIGVPEASDETFGYMSSSSEYADYEVDYFPDLPESQKDYVLDHEITHYFFVDGTDVYDLWFYNNRLPNILRETLLKSCYIESVTDIAARQEALNTEQEALEKCCAVMEAIQSGSCHIVAERSASGDPQSHWSTANYYQDNGNWLEIVDVDPESANIVDGEQYSVRLAYMVSDGVRYSNEGKWGKAYTEIQWREDDLTFSDNVKPWLASFQWDASVISYQDTMTRDNETSVMLRIDQPFTEGENEQPHYFVNFNFDGNGAFRNVYIQANVFTTYSITRTESIVSLDPDTVNAEIRQEYQKAMG